MDLLSSLLYSRYYILASLLLELDGIQCWPKDLWEQFKDKRCKTSKCILSLTQRFYYRNILCRIDDHLDSFPKQK
jgi:hypothetical protein